MKTSFPNLNWTCLHIWFGKVDRRFGLSMTDYHGNMCITKVRSHGLKLRFTVIDTWHMSPFLKSVVALVLYMYCSIDVSHYSMWWEVLTWLRFCRSNLPPCKQGFSNSPSLPPSLPPLSISSVPNLRIPFKSCRSVAAVMSGVWRTEQHSIPRAVTRFPYFHTQIIQGKFTLSSALSAPPGALYQVTTH